MKYNFPSAVSREIMLKVNIKAILQNAKLFKFDQNTVADGFLIICIPSLLKSTILLTLFCVALVAFKNILTKVDSYDIN